MRFTQLRYVPQHFLVSEDGYSWATLFRGLHDLTVEIRDRRTNTETTFLTPISLYVDRFNAVLLPFESGRVRMASVSGVFTRDVSASEWTQYRDIQPGHPSVISAKLDHPYHIVVGTTDGTVVLHNLGFGLMARLIGFGGRITGVHYDLREETLLVACADGTISAWTGFTTTNQMRRHYNQTQGREQNPTTPKVGVRSLEIP